MKQILTLILVCFTFGLLAQVPAFPDSTFNGTGRKVFSLGGSLDFGDNVIVQPDGKIVMTGATFFSGQAKLGVCRLLSDGSYDPTFGTAGKSIIDLGPLGYNGGFEPEMVLQSDGSILICGFTQEGAGGDDMMACKLLSNGSLDPSFGNNGKVWIDFFGSQMPDAGYAICTDATGNVYIGGSTRTGGTPFTNDVAIAKLTPAGVLDPSFSGDGKILLDISGMWDYAYGIYVRTDGKIIVGGYSGIPADAFAIRLNPDGSYDNTFSGDGKAFVDFFGQAVADEVWGMNVDPDGKILLVGDGIDATAGSIPKCAVARLTADGAPDPTFGGGDGIATFSISTTFGLLRNIIRLADGRYVASGEAAVLVSKDLVAFRLMNDGSLDPSFNNTGYYNIDPSGSTKDDFGYGLAIQADQKILLSGNTSFSSAVNEKYCMVRIIAQDVLAGFTASSNLVCAGALVQFTNTSMGSGLSYSWTFEGGTPSTSTSQNPVVSYTTPGTYDVRLIAYNSNYTDTLLIADMIQVIATPSAPAIPTGQTSTCSNQTYAYTTSTVPYANTYSWSIDPTTAGTLVPNGTSASVQTAVNWTGPFTLKVNATNQCGTSSWSGTLNCNLYHMPVAYTIQGEGAYCEGSSGASITLSNSEIGISYELYLDGAPTGNIQAGTGSSLNWNNITTSGFYTVIGSTPNCSQSMAGQIYVYMQAIPGQTTKPVGAAFTCSNATNTYSITGAGSDNQVIWTLDPAEAGAMTPSGSSVSIEWSSTFTGIANLSAHASNNCGDGPESEALAIEVNKSPEPFVAGLTSVCVGWSAGYSCSGSAGSAFTWQVTGGTITSGAGSSSIVVFWTSTGTGTVAVTENTANGCIGTSQVVNVNVDACVGLKETQKASKVFLYPNPVERTFNLDFSKPATQTGKALLTDATGRILIEWIIPAGVKELKNMDISRLEPGIYTIVFIDLGGENENVKLVRE